MATRHRTPTGKILYLKVFSRIHYRPLRFQSRYSRKSGEVDRTRRTIHHQVDEMAKQGWRVLALAKKSVPCTIQNSVYRSDFESGLIFLGLQGTIARPGRSEIAAVTSLSNRRHPSQNDYRRTTSLQPRRSVPAAWDSRKTKTPQRTCSLHRRSTRRNEQAELGEAVSRSVLPESPRQKQSAS